MARETWWPRRPGVQNLLGTSNWWTLAPGKAVPSFYGDEINDSAEVLHFFVDAIETIAPTGTTTGGAPRQYAGANKTMFYLESGDRTADTTFNDVVQGMEICDSSGADSLAAGSKILLVGFGSSTNPKNATRNLATDTTPWTANTAGADAQFWLIKRAANGDLYAVTDAGVAILGEWRVSKCPFGNDPTLAASWGNGFEVGGPEWGITGLAMIGDSVVVGKPDGLYFFDDITKRFINVLEHLIKTPHAVNGKGMKAITNGVLYPTQDGHLYFFDGASVQDVTPNKEGPWARDTAISRITAIADNGDTVAVVTECFQQTTQRGGMKVITYIAGTATDVTTSVTNGALSDGAAMATFGNAADDRIYVGFDTPFEAIAFRVTRRPNAASVAFDTPLYSDGDAGTVLPFTSSFTAFSAGVDWTQLSTSGISLVNTGFPPSASNSTVTWTNVNAWDLMTSTSLAFGGGIGTLVKYWVALKATASGTGMTNPTTIDEMETVPGRPGLPTSASSISLLDSSSTNLTRLDHAGAITHVYFGKRAGTGGFVWHDVYALRTFGGVWAMAWHNGRTDSSSTGNLGQMLVLWGRRRQMFISESPTRDPSRTPYPVTMVNGDPTPGPVLTLTPGGTWLDDGNPDNRMRMKVLKSVALDASFAQREDTWELYVQVDERDIKGCGISMGGPAKWELGGQDFIGRKFQAWLTFYDRGADAEEHCVELYGVQAEFEYLDGWAESFGRTDPDMPTVPLT